MMKIEEKAVRFLFALSDVYKDEEQRQLYVFEKLELTKEDLTDDFTAMLIALSGMYNRIVDDDVDLIDFTHILNKLAVQHIMEARANNEH